MSSAEVTTGRVLLVGDEEAIRTSLMQSLDQAGFYVQGESDGEGALERLVREQFDVLLSDLDLPGMDGFAVIRRAREARPELSVLLMTEKPTNETSIQADELGALFCLAKPVELPALIRALSSVIRRHVIRQASGAHAATRLATTWVETVATTAAKNEFSRVLERAVHDGPVRITKHEKPRAVLVSIDAYEELLRSRKTPLADLSNEFDTLLAQMQQPEAVAAMDGLFEASSEDLGRAALSGASGVE